MLASHRLDVDSLACAVSVLDGRSLCAPFHFARSCTNERRQAHH